MFKGLSIGIIGCGNMGAALVENIKQKFYSKNIFVLDKDRVRAENLAKRFSVKPCYFLNNLIADSGVVIVAVKPQDMGEVLKELKGVTGKMVISIAAGISISHIESLVGEDVAIVRAMPNLNALIGKSVTALCFNKVVNQAQQQMACDIFKAVGDVVFVDEAKINAVTAISGSGPAFVAYIGKALSRDKIINCFFEEAIKAGFDKITASVLANATFEGTVKMLENNLDADMFVKRVASKGGTTEAGLKVLESKGRTENALREAIEAAKKRAEELSGGKV